MDTNEQNIQINTFVKGMNTDLSYSNMQEGQYLYAENLRNYSLNEQNKNVAQNSYGEMRVIEGYKNAFKDSFKYQYEGEEHDFKIAKILAADTIRDIGIVIAKDENDNWGVIRIESTEDKDNIEEGKCKLIFLSGFGDKKYQTQEKNKLNGKKVSIVLTWETDDNIKLYIADGKHFITSMNVAQANDDYNRKRFFSPEILESYKPIEIRNIIFCGLCEGTLQGGAVQYAYKLYSKRGFTSRLSAPTKLIPLGFNNAGDSTGDDVKGALNEENVYQGVKLQIPVHDFNDNYPMTHIIIYRIHHKTNGQEPEISVIADRRLNPKKNDDSKYVINFTDYGNKSLQTISLDEYNSMDGIYIIPKVIESKNDRLFAANIKDDQSIMNEVAKLFDAKTFRVNLKNEVVVDGNAGKEYNQFIKDLPEGDDAGDYMNEYNKIIKHYTESDDVCKFMPHVEGDSEDVFYYGGRGRYIKWKFIITKLLGDTLKAKEPKIKLTSSGTIYHVGQDGTYVGRDNAYYSLQDNANQYTKCEVVRKKNPTTGDWYNKLAVVDSENIDMSTVINNNTSKMDKNPTYSNPKMSYAFKSLRRDELYRYGIVLYNAIGEGTPVLWIGDIRTPSMTETGFEPYTAYGQKFEDCQLEINPLGIQFEVDIDGFNEKLEQQGRFKQDFDRYRITSYEIVRCHRGEDDVQTVSQGVLARPIQRTKHQYDTVTSVDKTYTPTGTLTTQQYWTGPTWISRNGQMDDYANATDIERCEADNFENHDFFQFISPENSYNSDYMNQLYKSSSLFIQPVKYIFGQSAKQTFTIKLRNKDGVLEDEDKDTYTFNTLTTFEKGRHRMGDYGYHFYDIQRYDWISTAIVGHSLAVVPVYSTEHHEGKLDRAAIDTYYAPSKYVSWKMCNICDKTGHYLQGNQQLMICQFSGRTGISYYSAFPAQRNYWNIENYFPNKTLASYKDIRQNDLQTAYITFGHIHGYADDITSYKHDGKNSPWILNSEGNTEQFGYSKLYEQTNKLYCRNFKDHSSYNYYELFGNIDEVDDVNLDEGYRYKISNACIAQNMQWNELFDTQTKDGKTTTTTKYQNYTTICGDTNYCNVICGGAYNNSIFPTAKAIFGGSNDNIIDMEYKDATLIGCGGTTGLIKLKEDNNNILYRNLYTKEVLGLNSESIPAEQTDVEYEWEDYFDQIPKYANRLAMEYHSSAPNNNAYVDNSELWHGRDYLDRGNTSSFVDRFRNSVAGTYLCNIRKETIPYGGYTNTDRNLNTYVSFGDVQYDTKNPLYVFDGDCFIDVFEYTSCHKYYDKGIPCSITTNLNYAIPVETSINLAYTSGNTFSRGKDKSITQVQTKPGNVNDYYIQTRPEYEYNTCYSVQPQINKKEASDLSTDSNTLYNVDYRCYYSELKTNNENYDSWQTFKPANYIDVDDRYGEITHLRTFNDQLIFWQESATGVFSVNERSIISDESGKALSLGSGGVLERYDYYDRTAGMHKEQYCDTYSDSTLYWYDRCNNELKSLRATSITPLNKTCGTQNIMHEKPGVIAPVLFYDKKYNEVVSKVLKEDDNKNSSLAYSESLNAFTSVYNVDFDNKLTFKNKIYLLGIDNGDLNVNLWNTRGDTDVIDHTVLKYVVNKSPMQVKVFDNQEIVTLDKTTKNPYADYTYSWETDLSDKTETSNLQITDREGCFRYAIPRQNNAPFGNRMRGKYMICEMRDDKPDYNTALSYIMTKFRKSCN